MSQSQSPYILRGKFGDIPGELKLGIAAELCRAIKNTKHRLKLFI
jgi:hypothetical protein